MPVQQKIKQSLWGKDHTYEKTKRGMLDGLLRLHPTSHTPFTPIPTKIIAIVPNEIKSK